MNRLILTYNQSCNLKCDFCYIDFHHKKIEDKTIDVIKIAIENNFNIITFGGGDAFSKKSFRQACKLAKENNIITHVDTNAIAIQDSDYEFIHKYVDILGISIDAIGESYNKFRGSKTLFNKVDFSLNNLESNDRTIIKINTIVTKENKNYIRDIQDYISKFKIIKRWSLYQFFPLSAAKKYEKRYSISNEEYDEIINNIKPKQSSVTIELLKFDSRVDGYLFCDEEGNAYTNDISGKYVYLFSFFDSDIKMRILELEKLINPKIKNRYQ